ncbi:pimeloyl-ACP methyl ester carboxylesterase [Streptomonospora salina]|uniref:Pimeloyl-ACP methyl ester carboxylesterase n=1 Tax=Streptomonospora salina TaxID=104205 RepID=A0A841EDF2_9ACTN|nr:pimeloyl-ACP methyl ester carboxylesterase [Streptomonospora salina]
MTGAVRRAYDAGQMKKSILISGVSVSASAIAFCLVVTGIVVFSGTDPPDGDSGTLAFGDLASEPAAGPPGLRSYTARDGTDLPYRTYPSDSDDALVLLHGSGYHSAYLAPLARTVADQDAATVYTPDLRGHGPQAENRGDVDYVGQLEDDVSDFIREIGPEYGDVFLGGHSSGGGTAIRFAGGSGNAAVDGYVLLAPYIHHESPTYRADSGWSNVNVPRIAGLQMMNTVGITAFNDRDVISFNMPAEMRDGTETLSYSYDLQTSMHPRDDYEKDLAALADATLVVAGADDESFRADAYRPLLDEHTSAEVRIVDGASHFGVVTREEPRRAVARWLGGTG